MKDLIHTLRPALISLLVFTGLLGIGYPVAVGGIARVAFSSNAVDDDLIGQAFDNPAYFWSRPTAIAYNAMTSSGTNTGPGGYGPNGVLGPNPALVDAVAGRIQALRAADPGNLAKVPIDLVTASASGLDPHISPAAALYQVGRVARARGVDRRNLEALVERAVEPRTLGVFGEPRVNVVRLNMALDQEQGAPRP